MVGGLLDFWPESLGGIIRADLDHLHHVAGHDAMHHLVLKLGSAAWVVGLMGSLFFYGAGARDDRLEKKMGPVYAFLSSKLWFDEIYDYYVAKVQQRFASLLSFLDLFVIKGVLVRGSAGIVGLMGLCARSLHVGNLHSYVYWFLGGLLLLWAAALGLF